MSTKFTLVSLLCSSLVLSACNNEPSSPTNNSTGLGHIYTYIEQTPESPLSDPASCVNYSRRCNVSQLPFIAMSYPTATIENIMSRVVVSHDWMGERFATLLTLLPDEILTLLGSVTAVVIADNIRPSFYWTGSGAIYLDPASLWLTNAEKESINQAPDYREGFSAGLSYNFFHRFVKDGEAAYQYYNLSGTEERDIDDIIIPMASLLFHELAHANDFMPPQLMSLIEVDNPLWLEINRFSNQQLNKKLKRNYPISNSTLKAQASVLYSGQQATDALKSDTALELGILMQQEGANHLYAYSHQAEDVAMLFQASMLNYYYDIKMDSAFVIQPDLDNATCADYLVAWGQRNRIADSISKPRAQYVSQQLLPDINFSLFFDQLENVENFPPLINWCDISLTETAQRTNVLKSNEPIVPKTLKNNHHHGAITAF